MQLNQRKRKAASTLLLVGILAGCGSPAAEEQSPAAKAADKNPAKSDGSGVQASMKLTSAAFGSGTTIPAKYTTEGADVSPPLNWSGAPEGTESFALICDDPDAPSPRDPAPDPWVHWVIFNVPAERTELPEGIEREKEPSGAPGARQGTNSWPSDNLGYRGPAPPPGSGEHRYFFKVYALDTKLELAAGATKEELLKAMSSHILAQGQHMGTYERKK